MGVAEEVCLLHEAAVFFQRGIPIPTLDTSLFSTFRLLHRAGRNMADLYGGDFALTVEINTGTSNPWKKTALIQLKKMNPKGKVVLTASQVMGAEAVIGDSFVMAAGFFSMAGDIRIPELRVTKTERFLAVSKDSKPERKLKRSTRRWPTADNWIIDWLSCDLGTLGGFKIDGRAIEKVLEEISERPRREVELAEPGLARDLRNILARVRLVGWIKISDIPPATIDG
jgi:hypothetical protein